MKAVMCEEFCTPDKLIYKEVDEPIAGVNEVVIDVHAAACNNPDAIVIAGKYQIVVDPPFAAGGEGAGIISSVGEGVDPDGHKVGDRVLFFSHTGAFADKTKVVATATVKIPDEMSYEVASGFITGFGTTYHAFKQRANLQPGQHVLILGAAGGIGSAGIQVAKALGAQVIAMVGNETEAELCKSLGADVTFNHTTQNLKTVLKEETGRRDVDVILDTLGGDFSEMAFRCIGVQGTHLVIGFLAGIAKMPMNLPLVKEASIVGVFWNSWLVRQHNTHISNMNALFQFYIDGKISTSIFKVLPMADYLEAFELLAARKSTGKIVLVN
jgi:NADPH2:quinone reductase